jgi:hypothetical protein
MDKGFLREEQLLQSRSVIRSLCFQHHGDLIHLVPEGGRQALTKRTTVDALWSSAAKMSNRENKG